jgi:type IV secretory pathway VirB2 component (pilin)
MTSIRNFVLASTAFVVVQSSSAFAAGSGMPWEAPLTQVLESIEGPVARIVAVIIIIITGLSLATPQVAFAAWSRSSSVCRLPLPPPPSSSPFSPLAAVHWSDPTTY